MAHEHHPELIVLDLEIDGSSTDDLAARFAQQSLTTQTSLLLLGTVGRRQALPEGEYVSKPYHYAPLIRRIEAILSARSAMTSDNVDIQRAG